MAVHFRGARAGRLSAGGMAVGGQADIPGDPGSRPRVCGESGERRVARRNQRPAAGRTGSQVFPRASAHHRRHAECVGYLQPSTRGARRRRMDGKSRLCRRALRVRRRGIEGPRRICRRRRHGNGRPGNSSCPAFHLPDTLASVASRGRAADAPAPGIAGGGAPPRRLDSRGRLRQRFSLRRSRWWPCRG